MEVKQENEELDPQKTQTEDTSHHRKRMKPKLKPYSCTTCRKDFRNGEALKIHMRIHTGEKPHVCPMCDRPFADKSDLRAHIKVHTREKAYACNICDKTFVTKGHLKNHIVVTHPQSKGVQNTIDYKCGYCEKKFCNKSEHRRHVATHTGEKRFPCDICGRRFVDNYHMKRHRNTRHKNDHADNCHESSMYRDGFKMDIIEIDEKPFLCAQCGESFLNPDSLSNHLITHSQMKIA